MVKRKGGISLVSLVITIIVLIILTGAVIATFIEGGIIDRAKEAVKENDVTTLKEAYITKYNTKKIEIETGIGGDIEKLEIESLEEVVKELGLKGFTFTEDTVEYNIQEGKNEYIEEWVNNNFKFKNMIEAGYSMWSLNGKTYLTGVGIAGPEKTAGEILLSLGTGYTIYDINGQPINDETKVTTGDVIKRGNEVYATVIIKGELDRHLVISSGDISMINKIINNEIVPTTVQLIASDLNYDGIVSYDDSKIALKIATSLESEGLQKLQKEPVTKIPEIRYGQEPMYTWLTENDVIEKLTQAGYIITPNSKLNGIELTAGTTYAEFVNSVKGIIQEIKSVEITELDGNSNYVKVTDTSKEITNNAKIRIHIKEPYEHISVYYDNTAISFKVTIN